MAKARGPGRAHRRVVIGALLVAGAWGCTVVAGVDFGEARRSEGADAGAPGREAAVSEAGHEAGVVPPVTCGATEKVCNGACVAKTNPDFGCASTDCTPCSLALATGATCSADGRCAPKGCAQGFDDCDGDPSNGCETDLTRPDTCGSCKTKCNAGELCSPEGCALTCQGALVPCNGACVDTTSNFAHCGGCNKPCPGATNADPVCVNSACQIKCRAGFADCKSNPPKSCAPLPKWYVDGDGDGFGTNPFTSACAKPAGRVAQSGDCLDTNPAVHPGASASTAPFAGAAGPSFDYDCSGAEEEEGAPAHFPGACAPGCTGGGAVPLAPARAGAGVDNYCGSPTVHICADLSGIGGGCLDVDYDAGTPIACK